MPNPFTGPPPNQNSGIIPPRTGLTGVLPSVPFFPNLRRASTAPPAPAPAPTPAPAQTPNPQQSSNQILQTLMMTFLRNQQLANQSRNNSVSSDFLNIGKVTDSSLSKGLTSALTATVAEPCGFVTDAVAKLVVNGTTNPTGLVNSCQSLINSSLYSGSDEPNGSTTITDNVIWSDANGKLGGYMRVDNVFSKYSKLF